MKSKNKNKLEDIEYNRKFIKEINKKQKYSKKLSAKEFVKEIEDN